MLERVTERLKGLKNLFLLHLEMANENLLLLLRSSRYHTEVLQLQTQVQLRQHAQVQEQLARLDEQLQAAAHGLTSAVARIETGPALPDLGLLAHLSADLAERSVLDIGASPGESVRALLAAGFRVYACEPDKLACEALARRFAGNPDLCVLPLAVGETNDTLDLYLSAGEGADADLYRSLVQHPLPAGVSYTGSVPVPVRNLENLHADGLLPEEIALVRIDVGGAEEAVLRGLGARQYPVIAVRFWERTHPCNQAKLPELADLVGALRARGYRWWIVLYQCENYHSFYCNQDWCVPGAEGSAVFFKERSLFLKARDWCAAVLPQTCFRGWDGPGQSGHAGL